MTIQWPESLVREVAERRCIIVLGAGASMSCKPRGGGDSLHDWKGLLLEASKCLLSDESETIVREYVDCGKLLDAAQILVSNADMANFGTFVRDTFVAPVFQPSSIHESVHGLDPKIVVTTNYDDIYERCCSQNTSGKGFVTCKYYDPDVLDYVRSTDRIILKMHGCASNPQKMVLSRTQYHAAKRDFGLYFELLESLFMANTLLFVGCSLADPDFELMLESTNIRCPSAHSHYAMVEAGRPPEIREALLAVHNVKCLEYASGRHGEVVSGLGELRKRVDEWRVTH